MYLFIIYVLLWNLPSLSISIELYLFLSYRFIGVLDIFLDNNSFCHTCYKYFPVFYDLSFYSPYSMFWWTKDLKFNVVILLYFSFALFMVFVIVLECPFVSQSHKVFLLYASSEKNLIILTTVFKFLIQLGLIL